MTDIQAIIDAMAAALKTGLPSAQVYSRRPGSIVTPAIVFRLRSIDFDSSMDRGTDEIEFEVTVFTTYGSDEGETQLYDFVKSEGSSSVKQILEADETLGGIVDYLQVRKVMAPGIAKYAGGEYYGVAFEVYVGTENV